MRYSSMILGSALVRTPMSLSKYCFIANLIFVLFFFGTEVRGQSSFEQDFARARFQLRTAYGQEFLFFEKELIGSIERFNRSDGSTQATARNIREMAKNRNEAEEILKSADRNVRDALAAAASAAENNNKYKQMDEFVSYVGAAMTIYNQVETVYHAWERDAATSESMSSYLDRIYTENPALVPDGADFQISENKTKIPTGMGVTELNSRAYKEFIVELHNTSVDRPDILPLYEQLSEDIKWLEANPKPDWTITPDQELLEGEIRIRRALETLAKIDEFGPTYAEWFVEENQWGNFDFSTDAQDLLDDIKKNRGNQFLWALKIIGRPSVTGDSAYPGSAIREIYRESLMEIAPNYWLWRTRKPLLDVNDLKFLDVNEILDQLGCVDGCVTPPG